LANPHNTDRFQACASERRSGNPYARYGAARAGCTVFLCPSPAKQTSPRLYRNAISIPPNGAAAAGNRIPSELQKKHLNNRIFMTSRIKRLPAGRDAANCRNVTEPQNNRA